jgi:cation diffusion facilitator family transporter
VPFADQDHVAPIAFPSTPHAPHPTPHSHHHHHHHDGEHSHTHGAIDPSIASSARGLWAVKWSFVGLAITAVIQTGVFVLSDSIALLADLIHNIADASTAIPLGLAFLVGRWQPTRQFSYGYGRAEDLAGVAVVAIIAFSALVTGYESVERLLHPHDLGHLGTLAAAGIIGFIGNGAVSLFRIRVGKEIGSAALIADGYHARADSLVSLSVVIGALGIWLGFPQADPLMGLLITAVLLHIVWDAGKTMLVRMLDGVDPEVMEAIHHAVEHVAEVEAVNQIRARWLGHRLYAEVAIALPPSLSIQAGQVIASKVQAQLQEHIPYLAAASVQILPHVRSDL